GGAAARVCRRRESRCPRWRDCGHEWPAHPTPAFRAAASTSRRLSSPASANRLLEDLLLGDRRFAGGITRKTPDRSRDRLDRILLAIADVHEPACEQLDIETRRAVHRSGVRNSGCRVRNSGLRRIRDLREEELLPDLLDAFPHALVAREEAEALEHVAFDPEAPLVDERVAHGAERQLVRRFGSPTVHSMDDVLHRLGASDAEADLGVVRGRREAEGDVAAGLVELEEEAGEAERGVASGEEALDEEAIVL